MTLLLKNAALYAPESLGPGSVLIEGKKIAALYRMGEGTPDVEALDLNGAALGPGFIDLHTHGADRVELMDGGQAVVRMARFYARHGVTGCLPATVTASFEAVSRAVESARQAMARPTGGARVLGVHLEGPFISPQRLGAQSPEFCVPPTAENVARLIEIAGDVARIVTLAPEEEGGIAAIAAFAERGIIVSIGHTVATTEQAEAAFAAGASQVTHMFNGMPPLHHRRPGIVGTALTTEGIRIELIADGVHLHPTAIRMAVAAKGVDDVLLITDSISATGCQDGEYILGPMKVIVKDGEARIESGALAGSTLTLERAVTNVARWTDAGLSGAWQMASLNPARQLGMDDHAGRVAPGYDADLSALDAGGQVMMTMVGGEIVYGA
ncbi:MAG: N-acetylglucosamine-6-phosphate deacetylase [Dehalococcoidia bacterium]|nr:MAG: N-acetylglucosamine-6-phosphate deacetylase [Dehalococcoidia bacterium]